MKPAQLALILVSVAIVVVTAGVLASRFISPTQNTMNVTGDHSHENTTVEILESLDAREDPPLFQLHLQAPLGFNSTPEKIELISKTTGEVTKEFTFTYSENQDDCIAHIHEHGTVIKWNTPEFSVPEVNSVDTEYVSKLADYYEVLVHYVDGSSTVAHNAPEPVSGVCFHKAIMEADPSIIVNDEGIPAE